MASVFNVDEDDSENGEGEEESEALEQFAEDSESRSRKSSKEGVDAPIANADGIPLFEDADKRGIRTADYIKVFKLDQPHSGYKGQVPLSSTLETIAQLYGNGLYRFDVCNSKHRMMRSKENVRIDIPNPQLLATDKATGQAPGTNILELVRELSKSHDKDIERARLDAKTVSDQVQNNSKEFVALVKTTTEATSNREREFLTAISAGQGEFFKGMMAMQGSNFAQIMAILTVSHQQTIESLKATQAQNNPLALVQVMMQGIMLGKGMGGDDDDQPDWLKAMTMTLGTGKDIFDKFASLKLAAASNPLIPPAPAKEQKTEEKPGSKEKIRKKNKLINEAELKALITLKKSLLNRGIELEQLLTDANTHYSASEPSENPTEENPEVESDEESEDESSTPENNLGGEEST